MILIRWIMKAKPLANRGGVLLEVESSEVSLPPSVLPEIKLRRILVPVDFSDSSRKALAYAASLGRQFSAQILLLHVSEILSPPPNILLPSAEQLNDAAVEDAKKRLGEWKSDLEPRLTVRTEVLRGGAAEQIVSHAKATEADLVIMGTHGRKGISHLVMGSTAERVVRHAPCPVMVVREHEHDFVNTTEEVAAASVA